MRIRPLEIVGVIGLLFLPAFPSVAADAGYEDLLQLFQEFRGSTGLGDSEFFATPVFSPEQIAAEATALVKYQSRLRAIDSSNWPVSIQVDYHLVRAEMNGLEFVHRVLKPWQRDPGMYSDMIAILGELGSPPWDPESINDIGQMLSNVPAAYTQAVKNLQNTHQVPADLATLAIRDLRHSRDSLPELISGAKTHHPELVQPLQQASDAIDGFLGWLLAHQSEMTAAAGVGKDNYNWLLKNVYLFPYTWDELRTLVELEDNRVITFQRLEEHRNRNDPHIQPVQSQAEYEASVRASIDSLMSFIRDQELFSMPDYLTPDDYIGSWHGFDKPWPEKHDYFFNFSHRESMMEEAHEMVGHHFDQLRGQFNTDPIRKGWRPYKISTARTEGFAFALEELLMHAGYLDDRPAHAREIAYEQAAFRTVRALSDIYMHSNDWSLDDAMSFCVANAPHGELLNDSPHLWFEMATTLRGVGHHMLMVVGKIQFMKLMRDRAQQQGDDFELQVFMDEFFGSGLIPFSLIRWEMTGATDEIEKLW